MNTDLLTKWRHLIEPETSSGITPVDWDYVLRADLHVKERGQSVLVLRDCMIGGSPMRSIWVAAGELKDVVELVNDAERDAKQDGKVAMIFMGRRGWARVCGYDELSVVGKKEL